MFFYFFFSPDNNSLLTPVKLEEITYEYNLQNRLKRVETDYQDNTVELTEYAYNDNGIRVSKHTWTQISGTPQNDDVTVLYLIDAYNHTGYAQVLEETIDDGSTPILKTYTIGDDVIAQTKSTWNDGTGLWDTDNTQYLLYDGHGSTRQLAEYDTEVAGEVSIADTYSYDAYGVLLQNNSVASQNPGKVSAQQTSLLYAGEHFDSDSQQYYNRARWYNPLNGRFNRVDPYSGNTQDPQSLHKYLYVHNNPVNNIDPTGMFGFSLTGFTISIAIGAAIGALVGGVITKSWKGAIYGALIGAAIGAAAYLLVVYWPHIVKWIKTLMTNESGHHTVSNGLYRKMMEALGKNASAVEKANYLSKISKFKLWAIEWPIGTAQNLLKIFTNPTAFLQWISPTPAGLVGAIIAGGVILVLVYIYRDEISELWNDLRWYGVYF